MTRIFRPLTRRPLQIAFSCLLLLCMVQTLWWLIDQGRYTAEVRDRLVAARAAQAPSSETTPEALAAYRDALDAERRSHMWRYGWEGLFFLLVLAAGLWVIGLAIRQRTQLLDRQRNFVAAVTHELKNPLASLKLSAETLQLRDVDAAGKHALSRRMLAEVERLEALVTNLLDTARIDSGAVRLDPQTVALDQVVADVLRGEARHLEAEDIQVDAQIAGLQVHADPRSVRLIVSNLLDNAIKASAAAGTHTVRMRASREGDTVRFRVEDKGLGFPPHEAERLFTKFYRSGNELQRTTRGTGLGLYLVQRLCTLDGASVHAASAGSGAGATFTVAWRSAKAS